MGEKGSYRPLVKIYYVFATETFSCWVGGGGQCGQSGGPVEGEEGANVWLSSQRRRR